MKWEKVKLKDICEIKSGKRLPKGCDFSVNVTKYPYIRARDIKSGKINCDNLAYLDEHIQEKIKRYIVNAGDIVITIVGASVGDVGYVEKSLDGFNLTENAVRLTNVKDTVNSHYLLYVLNSPQYWELMQHIAAGSAQPKLGIYKIETISLELPPIDVQNKIASILSAYDDLIENNQKQIKLLEEAAQRLYKEWFVDLRFPGHEDVKIVDGVPEGWKKKYICDIADTLSGGTPSRSKEDYFKGNIKWIKTKELNDGYVFDTEERITELGFNNSSAKYFPENSIILAMYGATIGKLAISACEMTSNQACCVFNTNKFPEFLEYLFLWLLINRNNLINKGYGSAQQNLSREIINSIQIIVPTDEILLQFSKLSKEIFQKIKILQYANICLKEARDRLLPKLMSGEIEV